MRNLLIILFCVPLIFFAQTFELADSVFEVNQKYISHRTLFDYDKAVIRPESYAHLDSIADFLKVNPFLIIEIGNHCDERFSNKYSICLTCKRAASVKEYLVKFGISEKRIISKGYNDAQPLIKNAKTEKEHSVNRRTEIRIVEL